MKRTLQFILLPFLVCPNPSPLLAQWTHTSLDSGEAHCFAIKDTLLFAGRIVSEGPSILLSTDNGTSWIVRDSGLTNPYVYALAVSGPNIFAGTSGGVFRSTDDGRTWTEMNSGLTNLQVRALAASGPYLFAATYGGGVFLTFDNNMNWDAINDGLTNANVVSIVVSGWNLFAGTEGGGVFHSSDGGINWTAAGLAPDNIWALTFLDTSIFAGGASGSIFRSTDNGAGWAQVYSTFPYSRTVFAFEHSGGNLFAGTWGGGVILSTDFGSTWSGVMDGMGDSNIMSLEIFGENIFAGTSSSGVWKRPLSELITSVRGTLSREVPSEYSLQQNYPNPFNSSTTIMFSLPSKSHLSLKIFDALGREVSIVLADELTAGTYTQQWNAAALPSGVYFYSLQAGSFTETKKLMLLR